MNRCTQADALRAETQWGPLAFTISLANHVDLRTTHNVLVVSVEELNNRLVYIKRTPLNPIDLS